MLYFSKLKLVIIYFLIVFLSLISLANFFESEDNILLSKKVNLGLDLQGGYYLLLEDDSQPVLKQRLQDKVVFIRKALKLGDFSVFGQNRGSEKRAWPITQKWKIGRL